LVEKEATGSKAEEESGLKSEGVDLPKSARSKSGKRPLPPRESEPAADLGPLPDSPHDLLDFVLSYSFPPPSPPCFLDAEKSLPVPLASIGIFVTLLHISFFRDLPNADFQRCALLLESRFESVFLTPDGSPRGQFAGVVTIASLVHANQARFNPDRSARFLAFVQPFVEQTTRAVLLPHAASMHVIANRFISACFDAISLLEDLREVVGGIKQSLKFGTDVGKALFAQLILDFQVSTANKMFANPARFNFSHAMTWNSFLTVSDTDAGVPLPLLREVVFALNMAPMLCDNPQIAREICPTLPVSILVFMVMNFAPDEALPEPINPVKVIDALALDGLSPQVTLPTPEVKGFVPLPGMAWQRWKKFKFDRATLHRFPFISTVLSQ
jgi:hypothetical protein